MGLTSSTLLSGLFGKREMSIVMVGLDAAGKTTILYKLLNNVIADTYPTIGMNIETVEHKSVRFTIWDFGGTESVRLLWLRYYYHAQGIIFCIDSSDRDRIKEARDEFQNLLEDEQLKNSLIVIFANKQDLPNAMTTAEITEKLELHSISQHKWHIQPTCAISGDGLYEGLDWFANSTKFWFSDFKKNYRNFGFISNFVGETINTANELIHRDTQAKTEFVEAEKGIGIETDQE
ncbi:hypothetical protein BB559_006936 [Furculomyces boomerangus]|uniref:ADP-ribosylation factor n=2 Tax=Harpellales TaxID=61421 RepID=A0A2T9XZM2_9FUNG|nr:hypothetical protein BB559_006936 [Furculomyces boomerangus]PVZ98566.1 hypothetical protein BB558_005428 [Smittium angustum]